MSEEFYDREIAPKLEELANTCKENGMSLVALVEFEPNSIGETRLLHPDASLAMDMLAMCASSGKNVDAYIINLIRYLRKNNIDFSSSIVLRAFTKEPQS